MRYLLLISLLTFPAITLAASSDPWCLVRDETEICAYVTAEECYKVSQYGGDCRPNARFMGTSGDNKWCLVTATRRTCTYGAKGSCLRAARAQDGGCVQNTEKALEKSKYGRAGDEEEDFVFEEGPIYE